MKAVIDLESLNDLDSLKRLRGERKTVGGRRMFYGAYEIIGSFGKYYAIGASDGEDVIIHFVGENEKQCLDCFRLICDGGVAPCALLDVIEDTALESELLCM